MTRKRYTAPTGLGTLGLLKSTGPLIRKPDRTASGKDLCAQFELASVGRNRDFPRESERTRAVKLLTEGMAVEPNPRVPDFDDEAF